MKHCDKNEPVSPSLSPGVAIFLETPTVISREEMVNREAAPNWKTEYPERERQREGERERDRQRDEKRSSGSEQEGERKRKI